MMGTAATMGIEENLALANRRGKSRGLRPGITSQERDLFRAQLAALGLGLENRLTSKVGLLWWTAASSDSSDGNLESAEAPSVG